MFYTYAIGDVHGRYDLLSHALRVIKDDLHERSVMGRVVLLGDYIDRGPQSRDVLERLSSDRKLICLKGNHEAMMTAALIEGDGAAQRLWIANGGYQTLRSYHPQPKKAQIPTAHSIWLAGLAPSHEDYHRVYVHAGLYPGVPLAKQTHASMLWIRERFLRANPDQFCDGKHIVHGHTSEWAGKPDPARPELLAHRTNLDTGAYMTDVLTVGMFDDGVAGGPLRLLRITPGRAEWLDL